MQYEEESGPATINVALVARVPTHQVDDFFGMVGCMKGPEIIYKTASEKRLYVFRVQNTMEVR